MTGYYVYSNVIVHGDALAVLQSMPDNSVDAIVTDPPYGLSKEPDVYEVLRHWLAGDAYEHSHKGFMGKSWDSFVPGPEYWKEAYRVLKPGGHMLAFGGTRTFDLLTMAIRLAGFEYRDTILWIQGAGFPKSTNISKNIDKMAGKEREVIGYGVSGKILRANGQNERPYQQGKDRIEHDITKPATPEAQQWDGWGTSLKPAHEPIILARKPLAEKTIAQNVLVHGVGGIDIDATRVGYKDVADYESAKPGSFTYNSDKRNKSVEVIAETTMKQLELDKPKPNASGRWPSNLLLSHAPECVQVGVKRVRGSASGSIRSNSRDVYGEYNKETTLTGYADADGMETVQDWHCVEGCPVKELDRQSGVRKSNARPNCYGKEYESNAIRTHGKYGATQYHAHDDQGGCSRYFQQFPPDDYIPFLYASKSSRKERNAGCEVLPEEYNDFQRASSGLSRSSNDKDGSQGTRSNPQSNNHPCVKSLSICRWLIKLITPPDGVVLDMFCGSGSILVAAVQEHKNYIGIDEDLSYCTIAQARVNHALQAIEAEE